MERIDFDGSEESFRRQTASLEAAIRAAITNAIAKLTTSLENGGKMNNQITLLTIEYAQLKLDWANRLAEDLKFMLSKEAERKNQ